MSEINSLREKEREREREGLARNIPVAELIHAADPGRVAAAWVCRLHTGRRASRSFRIREFPQMRRARRAGVHDGGLPALSSAGSAGASASSCAPFRRVRGHDPERQQSRWLESKSFHVCASISEREREKEKVTLSVIISWWFPGEHCGDFAPTWVQLDSKLRALLRDHLHRNWRV